MRRRLKLAVHARRRYPTAHRGISQTAEPTAAAAAPNAIETECANAAQSRALPHPGHEIEPPQRGCNREHSHHGGLQGDRGNHVFEQATRKRRGRLKVVTFLVLKSFVELIHWRGCNPLRRRKDQAGADATHSSLTSGNVLLSSLSWNLRPFNNYLQAVSPSSEDIPWREDYCLR